MDSKIKDGHRLPVIISKEMETVPKSKGKEKARKELWDSLCAVYENEADKEIGEVEMEEVDVCELEEWTVTNPDTSMRALTQLAVTNPQILSAALSTSPENADLILELEHGDKKEIHEKQDGKEAKARLQKIKDIDEHVSDYCADLPRHTKYDLKLSKKAKSRHLKNTSLNENVSIKCNPAIGEDKAKHKFKELERNNKLNTGVPEEFFKEKEKNVPSVIVLHKYKKGIFNTQTESYSEEVNSSGKATQRPEKSGKKTKAEQKSNSRKHILSDEKGLCNELKKQSSKIEVEGKHSLDFKQKLKDKIRKKRDKGVVYKTLSTSLESKLRKKRKKLERQQLLKEVASTLNADTNIYDKIKTLPIKIDENQLIFMHPSHITKALEHLKIKNNNNQEIMNNDSTCNDLNENKSNCINKEEEKMDTSFTKLALDNNTSSKKLRVLSSIKKMRKPIPIVFEEKSDISFIKVSKHKKEPKKRRCKLTSAEKNKIILEERDPEKESRGSGKFEIGSNLMSSENYSKAHCSVIRQNVCFGDNSIDISNVQNNKLPTILSGSLKSKSKSNKVGSNLKNGSAKELKIRKINQKEMDKLKNLIKTNDENENHIKPFASEDENKLTFQLLKTNMNSKNLGRLRKNVYSVSDRMGSKENILPAMQNDRLYVTKRMLFYTNKESSSTSKESLNIAIRRDTEISNNGSSNNVLNVVIKQKKNSSTSTKSISSPKLGIENQCNKNCDTKSLEKMFVENYLEKIYNNKDMKKYKHLKEAECQTEENAFSSDSKEGGRNQVSTQSFELSNNTIQDEFRNFLTYHFKNINPAVWKKNALGKNNDEEMLNKKQTFQSGTEKIHVQCKFDDHYPNFLKPNDKSLTPENQYSNTKLSGHTHNFDSICCFQNNCNSELNPFIRVLENDEYNLQKTKCDTDTGVSKVNASDECKNEQNESDENKGITKLNVRIPENQCQQTESENIAEKLKNIGLSDKTSFVKVISSKNKLETSINTKVDSQDILKFKLMRSPRIKKDILSKPIKVNMKEDLKNVITRRQKSKFVLPKNGSLTRGMEKDNISNSICAQKIKNFDPKSTKENCLLGKNNNYISETYNLNTHNFFDLEKNKFQITVGDQLKSVKQNFINVLPANDDKGKKDDISPKNGEMANRVEVTKKTSRGILRNFILSEVGVQTETSDLLPSVPYKNVPCLKRVDNPNFDSKNEQNIKEADIFQEKPDVSYRNVIGKLIHIDSVGILPQEKGSFVHIINKKDDTGMYLNTNNILLEKNTQVSYPVNFSENKNQIRALKGFDEEKQIIDKINAVYDFLQYLDKILKGNSFLKLGASKRNTNTIGHFNSTLRCLCNNCIEILNKIEVNGIKNLEDRKPLEHFISQPVSEGLFFGQAISEAKNERFPNDNSSSNGRYATLSELKNNSIISSDLRSNNVQMNPFCVIVTPEEKSRQQICNDFFKKIDSNQSNKGSENMTSVDLKERSYEDFIKQKFSEMADKTSMNKNVLCTKISKSEINNNKITKDSNKRFYKQSDQRDIPSNDYSSKCLPLKLSLKKSYEPESKLNFVGYNHNSKHHPHDTEKPQFNCIINDSSKIKLDSLCSKNLHDSPGQCFSKQKDNSRDTNSDFCNSSKIVSSPLKNVSSRSKLSSKNGICQCFLSKNISSSEEIEDLQNGNYNQPSSCKIQTKPTVPSDVELCRESSNIKSECCSQSIKHSNKKVWLPKIKSSLRMSFKKDGKTAIKSFSSSKTDEKISLGKINFEEAMIKENNDFETQPKYVTLTKSQLNVKNNSNSLNFTKISEDSNHCTKCKKDSTNNSDKQSCEREIVDKKSLKDSKLRHVETCKGFGAQLPLSNTQSPRGSIIIIKRNFQKDSSTKDTSTSNSVEYLYSSKKCNTENESNQEDKDFDSDGWVPLNDVTEIENNQIYLGMDIKNMTVRHVEYVQKFPEINKET